MCMYICIHMTSKNISITEEVYHKLLKIKKEDESFSELFLRLLKIQKVKLENCFGAWNFSEEEKKEIWSDITSRSGRNWKKLNLGELN
jgi:predicted CopG family antitoxin